MIEREREYACNMSTCVVHNTSAFFLSRPCQVVLRRRTVSEGEQEKKQSVFGFRKEWKSRRNTTIEKSESDFSLWFTVLYGKIV